MGRAVRPCRVRTSARRRRRSRWRAPPDRGDGGHPRRGCPPRPRRRGQGRRPTRVPAVERGVVDLRMELDAPGEAADAEALRAAASWPFVDLDRAGRRLEAVLVPVQARARRPGSRPAPGRRRSTRRAAPRSRAGVGRRTFSPPCARASSCEPRQTPRNGISRSTASRISSTSGSSAGSHAACSPPRLDDPVHVEVRAACRSAPRPGRAAPRRCRGTAAADGG